MFRDLACNETRRQRTQTSFLNRGSQVRVLPRAPRRRGVKPARPERRRDLILRGSRAHLADDADLVAIAWETRATTAANCAKPDRVSGRGAEHEEMARRIALDGQLARARTDTDRCSYDRALPADGRARRVLLGV